MESCPSEAVLGPGDENRYPCTYPKGHAPGHSWEYPNQDPPSADLLSKQEAAHVEAELAERNAERRFAGVKHRDGRKR